MVVLPHCPNPSRTHITPSASARVRPSVNTLTVVAGVSRSSLPPTVRPFFVRLPSDVTGVTGGEAVLRCRVGGSPRPHILWRRHDGRMPVGRARLDANSSLKITGLTVEDAGVYICQAENSVATMVANATLTVYGEWLGREGGREGPLVQGEGRGWGQQHFGPRLWKIGAEVCFHPKRHGVWLVLTQGRLGSRLFGGQ